MLVNISYEFPVFPFTLLGGVANGLFFRKINMASVDQGLVHIVFKGSPGFVMEVSVSGTNTTGGVPIKVIISSRGITVNKVDFIAGAGDAYIKIDASGNYDIAIIPTTSIDYSFGFVLVNAETTTAVITNRSGYDLSGYTKIVN